MAIIRTRWNIPAKKQEEKKVPVEEKIPIVKYQPVEIDEEPTIEDFIIPKKKNRNKED